MEYSDSFCLFETQFFHFEILLVIYCERHISLRSILMCETLSKQWRKVCLRSNCFSNHDIQLKSSQQLYIMAHDLWAMVHKTSWIDKYSRLTSGQAFVHAKWSPVPVLGPYVKPQKSHSLPMIRP